MSIKQKIKEWFSGLPVNKLTNNKHGRTWDQLSKEEQRTLWAELSACSDSYQVLYDLEFGAFQMFRYSIVDAGLVTQEISDRLYKDCLAETLKVMEETTKELKEELT